MKGKWANFVVVFLLIVVTGYIVFDLVLRKEKSVAGVNDSDISVPDSQWKLSRVFDPEMGQLYSVTITEDRSIVLGGKDFVACYDHDFNVIWKYATELPVSALSASGSIVYAALQGTILLLDTKGEKVGEWSPFMENSLITSIASDENLLAFADAVNKSVFITDKHGVVKDVIGKSGEPFIVPSPFFDVAFGDGDTIYIANPGRHRIETRKIDGTLLYYFGKPGADSDAFFGCCNPSHFAKIPGGFATAEKGTSRIKLLDNEGNFREIISAVSILLSPQPLDIVSPDGKIIYGANPADSKLYVFTPL